MKKFKYKDLFKKLGLLLASLAILFVTLELLARLFDVPPLPPLPGYFKLDSQNNHYLTPSGKSFLKDKEDGTFRIFIFGGSSIEAQNFQLLRELLTKEFTSTHFEVINVGISSYGTNRIVPFLEEAAKYSPDLFIIYSGHNEFLELFLQENIYVNSMQFLYIVHKKLSGFRGYAFVYQVFNKLMAKPAMQMMEPIRNIVQICWTNPLSDDKRASIYKRYKSNIYEMINFTMAKNIEIAISTVAYNYVDDRYVSRLYYSSKHKNTQYSENQVAIENVSDEEVLELANNPKKDPYIENRLGKYYFKKQDYNKAAEYFVNAARVDFQPFRANDTTNSIIRNISNDLNILLADVEQVIIQHSNHMIPDFKLFDDWCHLNREGNRLMQITFFNTIKESNRLRLNE